MKLKPKVATFCPGCGHKNLELKSAPQLIINTAKQNDTKRISIFSKAKKKISNGLFQL